jgi:HEAT repeat protein
MKTICLLCALFAALSVIAVLAAPAFALPEEEEEAERTPKDVVKDLKDRDRGVKLLAVAECAEYQDSAVGTQLTKMLKDKDFEIRMAVIDALAHRTGEADQKRGAQALASRLKPLSVKLSDAEEYEAVIDALAELAQPVSIKALIDMKLEEPEATALARLMAVAEVPHQDAIDALIKVGSKGRNRGTNNQRAAATKALRHATGQKFNRDMDKWREWWRENRDTFDFKLMKEQRAAAEAERAEREARQEEKQRQREEKRKKREERESRN